MPEMLIGQSFPDELKAYNVLPTYYWDVWTGEVTFLPEVPQPIRDVVLAVLARHQPGVPTGPAAESARGRKPAR